MAENTFKLTYATMFNPPEAFHTSYEQALLKVKSNLGQEHGLIINGKDVIAEKKFEDRSPTNTTVVLGVFQSGSVQDAHDAVAAARAAFPGWSRVKWQERVRLLRKAADIMEERMVEIGAVISLETGKNRMEAMGDIAETIELDRYACQQMEAHDGYIVEMGLDPIAGYRSSNTSVMRPYGAWLVISPFNFPAALAGGPTAAALVTGNTVVMKPASDTPWTARLLAECMRQAGLPDGVCNFVTGPGSTTGQALLDDPDVAGITFTGSYAVGMDIFRQFARGRFVRPTILELGGKNPAIVTRNADLDCAATGIVRSAFGLQGQKCSACSRVFIDEAVYDKLVFMLVERTERLTIGDPTERPITLGPVINRNAYRDYQQYIQQISLAGKILTGGKILTESPLDQGYFCAPTIAELPLEHPLWQQEMFMPITTVAPFSDREEAMRLANQVEYGLTAGFYGSAEEAGWFFDHVQAGVTYVNRPQGATTGAWPGLQPFGGWKGSGSSGKNAGGLYYLPLYMHEQSRTVVARL